MEEQITHFIESVLQRSPEPGEVEAWVTMIESGNATIEQVRNNIVNSAEAQEDVYPVVLAYQAIYGRVPDAEGLDYWVDVYRANQDLDNPETPTINEAMVAVLRAFVSPGTPEFVDRFGENPTGAQFIAASYTNVLNREPDAEGLAYWTNRYNEVRAEIADANPDMSEEDLNIEVRSLLLEQFVSSAEYSEAAGDEVVAFLQGAADGTETYEGSLWERGMESFTLTLETDTLTGGSGNTVFTAPAEFNEFTADYLSTLQLTDSLDGGGGDNVLNAHLAGFVGDPEISNVQTFNLRAHISAPAAMDFFNVTDVETVVNTRSASDMLLFNVQAPVDLGMDRVEAGTFFEVEYAGGVEVATQNLTVSDTGLNDNNPAGVAVYTDDGIETLNLDVSNGVYLELWGDLDDVVNLNLSGSGELNLVGSNPFPNLVNLDSTEYTGDLTLNVSDSIVLESILTGTGDDRVVVNNEAVNGGLSADMGDGANTLAISGVDLPAEFTALDFTGGVTNVQTIAFTDGFDWNAFNTQAAVLNLDGVSDVTDIVFEEFIDWYGDNDNSLTIENGPSALNINFLQGANAIDLDTTTVENLTLTSEEGDIDFFGGANGTLRGESLVTVDVDAADDADLAMEDDGTQLTNLTTVNVRAVDNATLSLIGAAGAAAIQASQTFQIDVTGAPTVPLTTGTAGNVFFTSGDVPGGFVDTNYATSVVLLGGASALHDIGAAADIAAALDAVNGISATSAGNQFTIVWDDAASVDPLLYQAGSSGATTGSLNSVVQTDFTDGQAGVDGAGFETLETITVASEEGDAAAELQDVYGAFTLDVAAGDNAYAGLNNTGAVSVNVSAVNHAEVEAFGDTYGNADLEVIIVNSATADVYLADNLESFTALDVSGVTNYVEVDTSNAEFTVGAGQYISYLIGDTGDGLDNTPDVEFTGNDVRETYHFVGGDIQTVVIEDFTAGADPIAGDRLDLSAFGVNSAGDLIFTVADYDLNGIDDVIITDLGGDNFGGEIVLLGLGGQENDVATYNIVYA